MSKKNTKQVNEMLSESDEEEKKVEVKSNAAKETKGAKAKKHIQNDDKKDSSNFLNKKQARKESNDKKNANTNKKKKVEKKIELNNEEEEKDDFDKEEEVKPKKQIKLIKKDEKKNNEDNEEEDEDVKPKKKPESKKKKAQIQKEEEKESEPKLIKNEVEEETPKQMQKKTFSPGTCNELFIKNLSYSTTQEKLAEFFQKYGDIEETKVVYDKITQRSKGVGFCRFYDYESAARAMEDIGTMTLDGRPIAISYSNDKPSISKAKIAEFKSDSNFQGERFGVFVGNLSFKSNEKGIENFFKDCGKIIDIRIAKTPEGKLRGFAHVDLDSKESVEKALKKSGLQLDGREIRIDRSEQKPKTGGNSNRNSFGNQKGNFHGNKPDPISKAKKSGVIIETESKSKELSDSDEEQ